MARKRGGLAGFWDRNKGAVKNVVPVALSMIPGVGVPLAIGARAAMEGFDRPGQSGIGFDVSQGAKGAAIGAGQAALGKGIQGMFTGGKAAVAAGNPGGGMGNVQRSLADLFAAKPPIPGAAGGRPSNLELLSGIAKGLYGVRQGQMEQQMAEEELAEKRRQFDMSYGLNAAQEADRKRREDELMATRAAMRAMFAGGA